MQIIGQSIIGAPLVQTGRQADKERERERERERCTYSLLKQSDHILDAFVDAHLPGLDDKLGVRRLLVRLVDASEALDLTATSLLVQALRIATLTDLYGRVHVALEERQPDFLVQPARQFSVLSTPYNIPMTF